MYLTLPITILVCASCCLAFCGKNLKLASFEIDDVYGMWFGVGYIQHNPDLTNIPDEVGCVTLHIADVTGEAREDWVGLDSSSIIRHNWTNPKWRSPYYNPWSSIPMSGSWIDYRIKRNVPVKSDASYYGDRRIRIMWDENGQTEEQAYGYLSSNPGLWQLEQWRPGEREMRSRGLEMWYPEDVTRHSEYVYVLKSTPSELILYHCSNANIGRTFSMVLRRSPSQMTIWEWQDIRKILYNYGMPRVFRNTDVCAGCVNLCSGLLLAVAITVLYLFIT